MSVMPAIASGLASGIDGLVGLFSPKKAFERRAWRRMNADPGRTAQNPNVYAAAAKDRLTGGWSPATGTVNDVIGMSSASVRARVRQLIRDFPYFARAANLIADYVVGDGIAFQAKVKDASGNPVRKINQQIEDALKFWMDEADVAGKLHFNEMMRLAKRQDVEPGEFLLVKRFRPDDGRYLPYALQMYETDWLTTQFDRGYGAVMGGSPSGTDADIDIRQGIEYNRYTGRVLAYHFTDPDAWGKPVRIDASDVIHGFETLRPGQLRGISPFAPAVLVARDLSEYMDAEIDAAKLAAKILGSIKTPSPMGMGINNQWTSEVDTETGKTRTIEEMENAILKVLLPGEEMNIQANPRPSGNLSPFVKLILCMIAVTTGVPYELLSGDYGGFSFSTAKIVRSDFAQSLRPISGRHIRQFCAPAIRPFYEYAVMYGKLSLPGFFSAQNRYLAAEWQPPGMESADVLRDTKAMNDQVAAGTRSPTEIVKARGRDLEDVYKEIKAARDLASEIGLTFGPPPSTALANNPAALEKK